MGIINMWEHSGWGNSVKWFDWQKRRVVGWLHQIPEVNDEIRAKMESGKTARFKIVNVEPQRDPPDMFFATVEYVGYLEKKEKEES